MPARGIARVPSIRGYATVTNAPIRVDPTSNIPLVVPAGSGTTEVPLMLSATASGVRVAAGTGALVTGALTIATGLTTIIAASADGVGQATGTGTASAQLLGTSWVTGALTVTAYSISSITGATVAASTSTGTFTWFAIGV